MTGRREVIQNAATSAVNGRPFNVLGWATTIFQVTGTFTATITFEATIDGTNWVAIQVANKADGTVSTTATAAGLYETSTAGLGDVRARISAYTDGTITVTARGVSEGAGLSIADVDIAGSEEVDMIDRIGRLVGKITNYDVLANGTLGALNATVELACAGLGTVGLGLSGTWAGTVVAEVEVGDSVWDPTPLVNNSTGAAALSTTGNGNFILGVAGALTLRIRMSLYTSGTATVYLEGSSASAGVFLSRSMPTGVNSIGTVGLNAGTNNIGRVGSEGITISQTPTVTAGAYVAGDAVGGLLTFANAARVAGYGGVIKDVVIIDDAGQDVEMELWLFNQTFVAMADNAPWAPAEADLENLIAIITTSDGAWFAAGTPSAALIEVSQRYDCTGTSLFGQLVTRGTPTFVATDDVTVKIGLLQD